MQKDQKLVIIDKKKFFLKRMSFWIYFFIVANFLMFFAFTQDFYVQRFYASSQKNFKSNNESYKKEYDNVSSQISLLDKTLSSRNLDDCDNINNLKKVKTLPTVSNFAIDRLSSIIKIKEINKTLQDYYSYLDKTNGKFSQINDYNQDLKKIIPYSQNLTNICINYDRLMLSKTYSVSDDFLINRLITQVNELDIPELKSDIYFNNITKSLMKLKETKYSTYTMFASNLTFLEKNNNKQEFADAINQLVDNVQDFKQLVSIYQVVIIDNDNQLTKIKEELVASATKVNNQNLLDNILKISF
jgi:hypothetical protein